MKFKNLLSITFMALCISAIFFTSLSAQVNYAPPAGGWTYIFDGDADAPDDNAALDGTWMHDNASDSWAGDEIGDGGVPGGVNLLMDGATSYIRIQETGDPRDHGYFPDPSNRKILFLHFFEIDGLTNTESILDDGITLAFRARVATGPPLDSLYANDATEATPWPAEGNGYVVHDGGVGNFGVRQTFGGYIGFALAMQSDIDYYANLSGQGLVMNSLNGSQVVQDVMVHHGTPNILALEDPTVWHEFWITIAAGGTSGTHVVKIWADGAAEPQTFEVSAGAGGQGAGTTSYLEMGVGNTSDQEGAFDTDYFSYKEGLHTPQIINNVPATGAEFPREFALYNNYPNPFNPTTEIRFAMKKRDKINIAVYNALGQPVETLFDGEKPAGIHTVTFDSGLHSSGVYFYQMKVDNKIFNKKMLLLK